MSIRTILVPMLPGDAMERRLDVALPLARTRGAHLDIVLISPDPAETLAFSTFGVMPPVNGLDLLYDDVNRYADKTAARLASWRVANDVPSDIAAGSPRSTCATFAHRMGAPDRLISAAGRLADLIVLDRPARHVGWMTVLNDAAIFDTGRPVLLIPPGIEAATSMLRRVVIAWNGSLQAVHAVAGAMPLLHAADEVVVIASEDVTDLPSDDATDRPKRGEGLCRSLGFHDVHAKNFAFAPDDGEDAGAALLRQAHQLDASMIVMGAFTHSRVRQFLLGGVTRHMFTQSDLPLLVGH